MESPEKKARILVVDDEHLIADTLKTIFSNAGMEAMGVYSAEQALDVMSQLRPHMALIDVQLPGMNGIELAIRFMAEYPECRLTLFSGHIATADLLEKAKRDGYSLDVVAKPVHPTDLLRLVSGQLPVPEDAEAKGTA